MTDGLVIFNTLAYREIEYDGPIHITFSSRLALRGWHIENHDAEAHLIIPILDAQCDMSQAEREMDEAISYRAMADGYWDTDRGGVNLLPVPDGEVPF
jgi:hypothetical protein